MKNLPVGGARRRKVSGENFLISPRGHLVTTRSEAKRTVNTSVISLCAGHWVNRTVRSLPVERVGLKKIDLLGDHRAAVCVGYFAGDDAATHDREVDAVDVFALADYYVFASPTVSVVNDNVGRRRRYNLITSGLHVGDAIKAILVRCGS
jgi:hypothetical protein